MIFTYLFSADNLFEMSAWYYEHNGIIINDYNVTDIYVGF